MSEAPKNSRGALVVFEGLDRAGKSTQCAELCGSLAKRGHRVKAMRFPDRSTPIGQMIDNYLKGTTHAEDHVIHLLFSANRWEAAGSIEADIAAGTTVIIDRYYYSGAVYSAAKHNPNLSLIWARKPDEGLPKPDVCIFLSISPDEAVKRGGFGSEKYEKQEMQDRVKETFARLQDGPDGPDFRVVHGGRSNIDVASEVLAIAEEVVQTIQSTSRPLKRVEAWE